MTEEQDWTLVREYRTRRDWVQLRRYPRNGWSVIWGDKSRFGDSWWFTEYPCETESEARAKYEEEVATARKYAGGPVYISFEELLLALSEESMDAKK